jgi:hypothetical protein
MRKNASYSKISISKWFTRIVTYINMIKLSSRGGERLSSMTRQQPTKWQGAPPKKDETKNSIIVSEKLDERS